MKKGISTVIIALFIVSAVSPMVIGYESDAVKEINVEIKPESIVASGPMDSPWSMHCHDTRHTGRSEYSTANVTGLEKWRFRADLVESGIVIDNDGILYFGDKDSYLYALYSNGTLKWKYELDMWIFSTPALADDGTIYAISFYDTLYALNSSNGKLKWKFNADKYIVSSPAIADDGTIYFGTQGNSSTGQRIYAVYPNGTMKWQYKTGYFIHSAPAIGDDGTIYIGSIDKYLYAMYPNGTLRWRFNTGGHVYGSPSIADDGTVYIAPGGDYLYALYPNNGTLKWKFQMRIWGGNNPSIAEDGTIYVGCDKLYAVYPNGTMKWDFNLGEGRLIVKSGPAISADGTIYVGATINSYEGGEIIAVNPDGTERWRKKLSDEWIRSSPCIAEDGTVYIGSSSSFGGYLHAFGPVESNSPPETPTISGETNGKAGEEYRYTFHAVDPDNNPISFCIDWGNGNEKWTSERASGEKCYYKHTWWEKGNYTIRAKVKDVLGEESDWATPTLEVTMPKNQQVSNMWLLRWLERFPILQKILDVLRLNIR